MASNNVLEASVLSQASQCVRRDGGCPLCGGGGSSCLLSGPIGDVRRGHERASLDLRDYELDEVASQPMVLSEESLFDSGSESFLRDKGHLRTGAASALVSPEETSELFKSLKAVLRCFPLTDCPITNPDYMKGSKLAENTWSFKQMTPRKVQYL